MRKTGKTRFVSLVLMCLALIAAMALTLTACESTAPAGSDPASSAPADPDPVAIGEGATAFTLRVTDKAGTVTVYTVSTDDKTVGDALRTVGLIDGSDQGAGFFVEQVNGITADYNTDGTYWMFSINGEMAMTGVCETAIDPTAVYGLSVESM